MRLTRMAVVLLVVAACKKEAPPPATVGPAPGSKEWKIESAMSAAPAAVSGTATILDPADSLKVLRAGTNGWTCLPDDPHSPGTDPMCVDGEWTKWFQAWMQHKNPPTTSAGIAYMLAGSSDASNTDPFAMQPDSGKGWLNSGPHIMIISPGAHALDGLSSEWNTTTPYVMFAHTPYAHVMVPTAR